MLTNAIAGTLTIQRKNEFAQVDLATGNTMATGDGYSPYRSASGETAYVSTATNQIVLYTRGGTRLVIAQRRQPLGAPLFGPTISPDGSLIAYSDYCDRECPEAGGYTLIRGRDGQLRYQFKDLDPEDWTPDGRLLMTGGDPLGLRVARGVYVTSKDLRSVTRLLSGELYSPRMSPDGGRIAYVGTNGNIWLSRSDGTSPIQLTFFGRYQDFPTWSPDGRWLAIQFESAGTKLRDSAVVVVPGEAVASAPTYVAYAAGVPVTASQQMTWR